MTEDQRSRARELLKKRDFEGLESSWLALIEANEPVGTFLDLADMLLKAGQQEAAATLLSILVAHYKERGALADALLVLKRLAQMSPTDRFPRREIAACLKRLHPDNPRLDAYLSKSGLADDRPVQEAVSFIEQCLAFDVGHSVHDTELGVGRVVELDLLVDKLVVDFGREKPVSFHLGAAFKHLTALGPEHFLLRRQTEPDVLRGQARQEPLELLSTMLRSFRRSLKPKEIRQYLADIVPDADWEQFWNRVLKLVSNETRIRVQTKPERSYEWISEASSNQAGPPAGEPADVPDEALQEEAGVSRRRRRAKSMKAEALSQTAPAAIVPELEHSSGSEAAGGPEETRSALRETLFDAQPALDPEPAASPEPGSAAKPAGPRTLAEFQTELRLDPSPERWRDLLEKGRSELVEEWPELYRQAFLVSSDKRIWQMILRGLQEHRSQLERLVQETTTYYKKFPGQFLYLQRGGNRYGLAEDPKTLFPRLLDLLDSDAHKAYWIEIRNWLAEADDALIRRVFQGLTPEETAAQMTRIERMRFFEDFRKDEIRRLAQNVHPQLASQSGSEEEAIFSTRQGIEKKQAELRQLLDVDIPKSAEEIGKAREHGDLSENYEYKAAKEKQARLLARAAQLQRDLAVARPISLDGVDVSQVGIGTRVRIEETATGEIQEFLILGPWDIDPDQGIISYQAPFAQRLLGRAVGDFVPVNPTLPSGRGHRVIEIKPAR